MIPPIFWSVFYGSQVYDYCTPCDEDIFGIFMTCLLENRPHYDVMFEWSYRNYIDYGC